VETYKCAICGNTNYSDSECIRCHWSDYSKYENVVFNEAVNSSDFKGFGWKCPVCDNYNSGELPEFDVCPLCGREDDSVQSNDPNYNGGANWLSLNQAKANWMRYGVVMTERDKKEQADFYKSHIAPDGRWIP
jgi:hypothetical protein